MASRTMYEVMQQAAGLPLDEKLRVMTVLTEQIRLEANKLSNGNAVTNGHTQAPDATLAEPSDKPDPYFQREYAWLTQHRNEYPGEYIVIEGDRLFAHGNDGRKALAEARQAGAKRPVVVRVEAADELPFMGGW